MRRLQELYATLALVGFVRALSLQLIEALNLQKDVRHLLQHLHELRSVIVIVRLRIIYVQQHDFASHLESTLVAQKETLVR